MLKLERAVDLRRQGWVTADTHVHFISPHTAWLEAQAEGLNVINLLAAQWGDLYTNVGDITGGLCGVSRDDCVVWVGTENRQHFLGHMSMLGVAGGAGVPHVHFGRNRGLLRRPDHEDDGGVGGRGPAKDGLVVVPHFPYPHSEIIAEIVRGRVDGVEFWDFWTPTMDSFSFHELYRLLNCGYRVAVVGGTDKMSAGMPVGNVRTYAHTGDDELSFDSWARAVRAGRTYTTSGPLVRFSVEGRQPGDELKLPAGGGVVHVEAEVASLHWPGEPPGGRAERQGCDADNVEGWRADTEVVGDCRSTGERLDGGAVCFGVPGMERVAAAHRGAYVGRVPQGRAAGGVRQPHGAVPDHDDGGRDRMAGHAGDEGHAGTPRRDQACVRGGD